MSDGSGWLVEIERSRTLLMSNHLGTHFSTLHDQYR